MPALTTPRQRALGYAQAQIDNPTLEAFAATAERVHDGAVLDDASGTLLLALAGPIARELQQRRRAADLVRDLVCPDTVLMFPGAAE